eukprot:545181-Amphidinium_carterae.1
MLLSQTEGGSAREAVLRSYSRVAEALMDENNVRDDLHFAINPRTILMAAALDRPDLLPRN